MIQDLRHAIRALRGRLAVSTLVVVVLALGIGTATTIFSVVDQTVLRRPPFLHGDRLVDVQDMRRRGGGGSAHQAEKIMGWREQGEVFERLETYAPRTFDLEGGTEPERIRGLAVSVGLFEMLGVQPSTGRGFTAADVAPGAERVAILSRRLIDRRFGSMAVLGTRVRLSDELYTVVGVMPASFVLLVGEQAWVPLSEQAGIGRPFIRDYFALGRLRSGLSVSEAQERANAIADRLTATAPLRPPAFWDVRIDEKRIARTDAPTRTAMLALLGAVTCLLLLACVSVAQLLLARSAERATDLAVRAALGASRGRLLRQLMIETSLLAAAGGVAGVAAAEWAVRTMVAPRVSPLVAWLTTSIHVDARVLAVSCLATALTAILAGLVPAWRGARPDLDCVLRQVRQHTTAPRAERTSFVLVSLQIACTLALVVGAALMGRTLWNIYRIDLGFDADSVVTMRVDLPVDRYPTYRAQHDFFERVRASLIEGPTAVARMAVATNLTGGSFGGWRLQPEDGPPSSDEPPLSTSNAVTDEYFETLGIRVLAGRTFARDDLGTPAVVLGRTLAERLWPRGTAVGARLRDIDDPSAPAMTVVGVVDDVDTRLDSHQRIASQWYTPRRADERGVQPPGRTVPGVRAYSPQMLIVRTNDVAAAVAAVKAAVRGVDPWQPVERVTRAVDAARDVFAQQRLAQQVFTLLAAMGALLAGTGVFGVLSQVVARRTRELGIRLALGATPARVRRWVLMRSTLAVVCGLAAGIGASAALGRWLTPVLYEVSPWDPISYGGACASLTLFALAAAWLPAHRAARVDPAAAIRIEA